MSTISMEVIEEYLAMFIELDKYEHGHNKAVYELPIFKDLVFEYCCNPEADPEEDSIVCAIKKSLFVDTAAWRVKLIARNIASEICSIENTNLRLELLKLKKKMMNLEKECKKLRDDLERMKKR